MFEIGKRRSPFVNIAIQTTLKKFFAQGNGEMESLSYITEGTDFIITNEIPNLNVNLQFHSLQPVQLFFTRRNFLTPILAQDFISCLKTKIGELSSSKIVSKLIKNKKYQKQLSLKIVKYLQVINWLENGYNDYAEIARRFDLERQEIRHIDKRLKKTGKGLPVLNKKPKN